MMKSEKVGIMQKVKKKKKKSRFILKEKYMPKINKVPRITSKEWRSSIHFINTESSPLNA